MFYWEKNADCATFRDCDCTRCSKNIYKICNWKPSRIKANFLENTMISVSLKSAYTSVKVITRIPTGPDLLKHRVSLYIAHNSFRILWHMSYRPCEMDGIKHIYSTRERKKDQLLTSTLAVMFSKPGHFINDFPQCLTDLHWLHYSTVAYTWIDLANAKFFIRHRRIFF